jgi:putative FmdB family regulatory protein
MPTYEYRCAKGHHFERVQKISDRPLTRCPDCGAKAERVISGGQGLIFKGSGFYITDYGKDGKGARKEPDAPAAKAEKKGDGGKGGGESPSSAPKGGKADPS